MYQIWSFNMWNKKPDNARECPNKYGEKVQSHVSRNRNWWDFKIWRWEVLMSVKMEEIDFS